MKWFALAILACLALVPQTSSAQRIVPIGSIAHVDDPSATTWAMSGYEMIRITTTIGNVTPIMRTETMDARTVEILSRVQAPPPRPSDIRAVSHNGKDFVVVRDYLLIEVQPQDARAAGMSTAALAQKWAASVRNVLPKVAPLPGPFGI
jgi:hypothetical protein